MAVAAGRQIPKGSGTDEDRPESPEPIGEVPATPTAMATVEMFRALERRMANLEAQMRILQTGEPLVS